MSLTVFFAVLFAAFVHALWNAVIKGGGDKFKGMIVLTIAHAVWGGAAVLFLPLPAVASWGWLAASVLIHAGYQTCLALAYSHGDLSRVYPISRGTAPLAVLVFGYYFLSDTITIFQYLGVALLGIGILLMARGIFVSNENRKLLIFALGAAAGTAGYTIADGVGARVSENVIAYVAWMFLLTAPVLSTSAYFLRGRAVFSISPSQWRSGFIAGTLSAVAYWIAVWGMTQAPIALVAALRETSILFAVLLGVFFFGEKLDRWKIVAAVMIVIGVIVTRL
jgi:drug/metabolite transporter (DMT)-like permease